MADNSAQIDEILSEMQAMRSAMESLRQDDKLSLLVSLVTSINQQVSTQQTSQTASDDGTLGLVSELMNMVAGVQESIDNLTNLVQNSSDGGLA